jgi:hypothetical protein
MSVSVVNDTGQTKQSMLWGKGEERKKQSRREIQTRIEAEGPGRPGYNQSDPLWST